MKKYYSTDNLDDEYKKLAIRTQLENEMSQIDIDYAGFTVDDMGIDLFRIFIYPLLEIKEFDTNQILHLKKAIEEKFNFKDLPMNGNIKEYEKRNYIWSRDFREREGNFYLVRKLKNFINLGNERKSDLTFIIERSPKLNCRIERKKTEIEIYEAICE